MKVEDHPLDYRNFEGTIPKGQYGGGTVMLWDEGTWEPLMEPFDALAKGELKFTLKGQRLKGNWVLIKWNSKWDKKDNKWLLIKERDEFAREDAGISGFVTSIKSDRTMKEIEENKQKTKNT